MSEVVQIWFIFYGLDNLLHVGDPIVKKSIAFQPIQTPTIPRVQQFFLCNWGTALVHFRHDAEAAAKD